MVGEGGRLGFAGSRKNVGVVRVLGKANMAKLQKIKEEEREEGNNKQLLFFNFGGDKKVGKNINFEILLTSIL